MTNWTSLDAQTVTATLTSKVDLGEYCCNNIMERENWTIFTKDFIQF